MIGFWDRVWAVNALAIRDYYREREEQRKKWENFCQQCMQEIIDDGANILKVVSDATSKQSGVHVHKDLVQGIPQLPLYGFFLVLNRQGSICKEQSRLLQMYFAHFDIPFSMNLFLDATKTDNYTRKDLLDLVGISETYAGGFWVQFFKTLYRTDEDTSCISKVIDSFCSLTMRFAAMSGKTEDYLLAILEKFLLSVHLQADLCRQAPDEVIDFYGDAPFTDHFKTYKENTYKVCRMTMDENDEELNPLNFFTAFSMGIIYQVIRRCTRNRADKIKIMDDVLEKVDIDTEVDGAYIFKYMEDLHGEETSMLAAMAHIFTDIEEDNPVGWIILTRGLGTYNLRTHEEMNAVQDALNFIIGMENYLADKYPMSGFGLIASDYGKKVMEIINRDIDQNMTIV